jgi:hypothetical protein
VASILILLPSIALAIAILRAGAKKNFGLEQSLLIASALMLFLAVLLGWGGYSDVHGGAILLILIAMSAFVITLAEFVLLIALPSKYRFVQFCLTIVVPILLIGAGAKFGGT